MTKTILETYLWFLRHWLQFWQLRTWIYDNLCDLTIKSDTGQHFQFKGYNPFPWLWDFNRFFDSISEQREQRDSGTKGLCPLVPSWNSQPWEPELRWWKVPNNLKGFVISWFSITLLLQESILLIYFLIFQPRIVHKSGGIHPLDNANHCILGPNFSRTTRMPQQMEHFAWNEIHIYSLHLQHTFQTINKVIMIRKIQVTMGSSHLKTQQKITSDETWTFGRMSILVGWHCWSGI